MYGVSILKNQPGKKKLVVQENSNFEVLFIQFCFSNSSQILIINLHSLKSFTSF